MILFGVVIALFSLYVKANHDYDLDRLLHCPLKDKSDYYYLQELVDTGLQIDIFEEKVDINSTPIVHVLTDNEAASILMAQAGCFEEKSIKPSRTLGSTSKTKYALGTRFHDDYRSYQNMVDQLYYHKQNHPDKVKALTSIGKSHENRDLMVIHITAPENTIGTKPLIWIMSGQHAREWVGPAATMFLVDQLLTNHASEKLLDDFEFAVLPLVNPDGYEFSRIVNRMWRKNRRPNGSVDLNRNWDILWGEINSSQDPSAITYAGPFAASEPEISSTQNYILGLRNRKIGFDLHSYSQLVLRNYSYTEEPNPLEYFIKPLSERMADKMSKVHGSPYKSIVSAELAVCSGTADDWFYVKAGIPGFTIELRDQGRYGFNLPKEQIRPTGEELFAGIIAVTEELNSQE